MKIQELLQPARSVRFTALLNWEGIICAALLTSFCHHQKKRFTSSLHQENEDVVSVINESYDIHLVAGIESREESPGSVFYFTKEKSGDQFVSLQQLGARSVVGALYGLCQPLCPQVEQMVHLVALRDDSFIENGVKSSKLLRKEGTYAISDEHGPYADIIQFRDVLRACAGFGKSAVGIGCCLGDESCRELGNQHLQAHEQEVMKGVKTLIGLFDNQDFLVYNSKEDFHGPALGAIAEGVHKRINKPLVLLGRLGEKTGLCIQVKGDRNALLSAIIQKTHIEAFGKNGEIIIDRSAEQIVHDASVALLRKLSLEETV